MWSLLVGVTEGIDCTGTDQIWMITERCTPSGNVIDVRFTSFMNCFFGVDGAAVYIVSDSFVSIRSDSFFNCAAGTHHDNHYGGCAYAHQVKSGTRVIDSCAARCGSCTGSFVYVGWLGDLALKGISVFDCSSGEGAVCGDETREDVSWSNLTRLRGEWGLFTPRAAALYRFGSEGSTDGNFLLFANCSGGYGCVYEWSGVAAVFRQCSFVDNAVGAIAHSLQDGEEDLVISCYFANTNLRGSLFESGSVLVDSCLFAGEVQSTAEFILTGVQVGFTSTEICLDTSSLPPTCGGVGVPPTAGVAGPTAKAKGAMAEDVLAWLKHLTVPASNRQRIVSFVAVNLVLLALGLVI
jgi:hypothetical protein